MAKRPKNEALKLVERLLKITPEDDVLREIVVALHSRLKNPMTLVLAKVPGSTVVDKCAKIGITRQNYYAWLDGQYRPNVTQAKRLTQLTGLDVSPSLHV